MYLYHATDKANMKSILTKGLLKNCKSNWSNMYCADKIYLAFNPSVAEDYVFGADNPPEEIVIFKIDFSKLNQSMFQYDWNNRCEYERDINSVAYLQDIEPSAIVGVCDIDDSSNELKNFKHTLMYDIILDTFYEECETNLEDYI